MSKPISLYLECIEDISARGVMVDSAREDGALVKNPSVAMARDALTALRGILADLGITPAARARVALPQVITAPAEDSLASELGAYL